MILRIPKSKDIHFQNGFDESYYHALFKPTRMLGYSNDQIYLDSVLIAMLIHAKQSKKVLDLGSYFGMLAFVVEDLHTHSNINSEIEWILVDNCMYIKELYQHIRGEVELSGVFLPMGQIDEWKKNKVSQNTQTLFDSHGEFCLPPVNAEQFQQYWKNLANNYLNIKCPNMTMYEDLNLLNDQKFDFVIFDLSAGQYENNLEMFSKLQEYITEETIIVLDDITPKHPNMMALFEYIMKEFNYSPVAFSPGKIAVIHPEQKESFLLLVKNHIIIESLKVNGANHSCSFNSNPIWGTYLQLNK